MPRAKRQPEDKAADRSPTIADLRRELAQARADRDEALAQQTATAEVLGVINSSPGDLTPVFDTLVRTAARLCAADHAGIYRNESGVFRWAAGYAGSPETRSLEYERIERELAIRPGAGTVVGRAALERNAVQIIDAMADPLYEAKGDAQIGGVHTLLGVPLMHEGEPIGVIALARCRMRRSPSRRSNWHVHLLTRRSSRWRTRACWANCASALGILKKR